MSKIIDPGFFSKQVSADNKRGEFNTKNTIIVEDNVDVDFVFMGDSITDNCEINAYLGRSNKMILNRGISGDSTEYVLKRFDADVIQLKPKHCILLIGVNDAWDLEYEPWSQTEGMSVEAAVKRAYENIKEMSDKAKSSNINLIMCSILPTNMTFTNRNKERNIYVEEVNSKLRRLCEEENLIYVDYYSEFVEEGDIRVKDGLTFEGLHPNTEGYNLMMKILKETLSSNDIEF
ncbi:sialate O-acetylesterase [Clostridium gelidum]|uniref:Sialate O-acetylesterase n=1 Tax=Clostridium gelidum TaxID=704125 RepID=A0ABM7SWZ7_9CLOT|nr:GDSL-type esterase/lipase family protein [Clostridium gelidum]BCZ44162.1 sialate O-acetylesterase [Clostridium gelidum]